MTTNVTETRLAVLDEMHTGDIRGALGTIRAGDIAPRLGLSSKLKTLLAIAGPGLIVMVGDNDAGAFATYGQAGQDYGTRLLWTLLLLVQVLYVNQEMVLRLGAVTGVGHARLILERFGKFWGVATSYALGDVLGLRHSLHRGVRQAKGFYAVYGLLIAGAAALVLIPAVPLGLLTEGVQVLAGVLLPSATVFLLLLCNDRDVLGPWVNGRALNAFTSAVIGILITLSVILTASVLFPGITAAQIGLITVGCGAAGLAAAGYAVISRRHGVREPVNRAGRANWRMPPLAELSRARMSTGRRIGMGALRLYLLAAMILVIVKIVQVALGR